MPSFPIDLVSPFMDALVQRTFELSMIQELTVLAKDHRDGDDLLELLMEKSMAVIGAQIGSVFVVEPATRLRSLAASESTPRQEAARYRFRVAAVKGHDKGLKKGLYINIEDSVARVVFLEKRPLLIEDIEKDARTLKRNDPKYGPPSFLSMPIFMGDAVYGVLNLSFNKTGQPFSKNDEMVLSILFRNISSALENAILQSKVAVQMEKIKGHNLVLEKEIEGRIRTERALRESEKQYRLLVENSSDIIYTITLTGHFIYMNPVAEHLTGYPQSDLVGKHYFLLVHPDYHETLDALYKKQFYEKIPNTYSEFPIIVRDGAIRWIGQNVQLLVKDDCYIGFQAAARDITARHLAEEALQKSQDRFRILADSTFEGIVIHENGRILDINRSALEMFGYEPEEAVGKNLISFVHPDYLDLVLRRLEESRTEKEPLREPLPEIRGVKKDGTVFPIEVFGRSIPDEHPTARVVAIRDITKRKEKEEQISSLNIRLAEANKELETAYAWMRDNRDRLIADQSKNLIAFLVDRDGMIIGMTEEVLRFIDWPRDRIIGVKITDLLLEEFRAPFLAEMGQVWIDMDKQISVGTIFSKEEFKTVKVKMTRLTLNTRRLLLVTMQ
ncbi:MAG: hypothetical protein CSYNP_02896 [Syntrophus sp. SKADARSKE-3]|nr:hypothetical protein [Syntrophus sp. SKADARSKE-3]